MASAATQITTNVGQPLISAGALQLLEILEGCLHGSKGEWLFFRELRVGTGRRNRSAQRLDAFALNCLPHLAMKRVCYEVKTSRADYLCELKQPIKRRMGMRYSNEFYFVAPPKLLRTEEIPVECGLIEAGVATADEWRALFPRHTGLFHFDPAKSAYCVVTVPAPWRDSPGPTWEFTAAMLRNQQREFVESPPAQRPQERFQFE